MKNPAESMAGTTAMFSVVFSGAPKSVGSELPTEAVEVPLLLPLPDAEHPPPGARPPRSGPPPTPPRVPMYACRSLEHLTELAADHPCPGRINQHLFLSRRFTKIRTFSA